MKQMYKVIFSYKQDSPSGGNSPFTGWTKEIKLYEMQKSYRNRQTCFYMTIKVDIGDIFQLLISLSCNSNSIERNLIMTVQELINKLMQIEDKSKEVRLLSADHSNDAIGEISVDENIVYLLGE